MRCIFLLLVLVRCGGPVSGDALNGTDACPSAGAVVITELAIRGSEYVELFNSGREGVELATLDLSVAGSGAPREVHINGRVGAGRYTAVPVSALADGGGTVEVSCAGRLVDVVRYGRAESDVIGLDGAQQPDAAFNDAPESWCAQPGTAGGANPACGAAACTRGEAPARGDVVVNEVMRDPAGADTGREWLELRNVSNDVMVLDGLVVEEVASSTRRFTLVAPSCFTVEPGALVVLVVGGKEPPALTLGGGLFNDRCTLRLRISEIVLDEVEIDCGRNGSSCALVDERWCEAATPTPGEENVCAD